MPGVAAAHVVTLPGKVYWANEATASIGRANLDGTGVDAPYFISAPAGPHDLALDGTHIWWTEGGAMGGAIGRASLDGANVQPSYISTTGSSPHGITLQENRVFWTHTANEMASTLRIGSANKDGTGSVGHPFVTSHTDGAACGLATDGDEMFWANNDDPGRISSVHGPFAPPNHSFITATDNPCGIAVAGGFVYWTNRDTGTIGRASLDGTNQNPAFITTGGTPCGVAVDGAHVYWTDQASDTIGRAPLDGSADMTGFSIDAGAGADPCGIAVDPVAVPSPTGHAFANTVEGEQSDQHAFEIINASSSVLDVAAITLLGGNPSEFEITGDSCTSGLTPAGGSCLFNMRFAPSSPGPRSALAQATSPNGTVLANIQISGIAEEAQSSGGSGGGEKSPPPADREAPVLSAAAADPRAFKVDAGTSFGYTLSEAASVEIVIERRLKGRLLRGTCVRQTRANRRRAACARFKEVGRFGDSGESGANETPFSGSIGTNQLASGRYRAILTASDAAANDSAPLQLSFRVLK